MSMIPFTKETLRVMAIQVFTSREVAQSVTAVEFFTETISMRALFYVLMMHQYIYNSGLRLF